MKRKELKYSDLSRGNKASRKGANGYNGGAPRTPPAFREAEDYANRRSLNRGTVTTLKKAARIKGKRADESKQLT